VSIRTHLLALGIMVGVASPAAAAEDLIPPTEGPFSITGSLALTSEYFFRAISQSDDSPAVQGGLNANYDLGFATASAGVWASNVDFGPADVQDATVEVDYLVGLSGKLMEKLSWNFGGIYYSYPGANNSAGSEPDYWEVALGSSYDFGILTAGVSYNYSPDFFANSGEAHYVHGKITVPLWKVDLIGAVGKQWIEKKQAFAGPDYIDYKLAVAAKVYGFDLDAAFIDTTENSFNGAPLPTYAQNQFVFTVTKNF